MKSWVGKMLRSNQDETQMHRVQAMVENDDPLESQFPEDLFSLFNQQIGILGEKLNGELLLKVITIWMNYLQDTFEEKTDDFLRQTNKNEIIKFPLEINDFNRLSIHLNDSKGQVFQYFPEDQTDKVHPLFVETAKLLSKCVDRLLNQMVEYMFIKIEDALIEQLFTPKWSNESENIVKEFIDTIEANMQPLQTWLSNPVHLMRAMKISAERFVYLYLERFIYYIKLVYGRDKALEKFEPVTYRPTLTSMKQRTPERERLENRVQTLHCLARDYDTVESWIRDNDQTLSPSFANDLLSKAEMILGLLRLDSCDFVTGCHKYRKVTYARECIEAVIWIRKDVDNSAMKLINLSPDDDEDEIND